MVPGMKTERKGKAGGCPICGRAPVADYRPFCSRRCADVDLGRWFKGRYVLPGSKPAEPEDMAKEAESAAPDTDPEKE